jgi:hypothetical protein
MAAAAESTRRRQATSRLSARDGVRSTNSEAGRARPAGLAHPATVDRARHPGLAGDRASEPLPNRPLILRHEHPCPLELAGPFLSGR